MTLARRRRTRAFGSTRISLGVGCDAGDDDEMDAGVAVRAVLVLHETEAISCVLYVLGLSCCHRRWPDA